MCWLSTLLRLYDVNVPLGNLTLMVFVCPRPGYQVLMNGNLKLLVLGHYTEDGLCLGPTIDNRARGRVLGTWWLFHGG